MHIWRIFKLRALFCYFSATGNTKKCVDLYQECLHSYGVESDIHNIDNGKLEFDPEDYDMVFFAYPIHGFNAPENVLKFAKTLKRCKEKKRLIILKTSGEHLRINNISSYSLRRILKRRNYYLTNEYHYIMPYDIIFRHTDLMAYNMYEALKGLVPLDVKDILNNKIVKLKYMPFGHILQLIMLIEHPGAKINGLFMHTNKNCISCGLCVKACPTKNIILNDKGKIQFKHNCLMCTRCAFYCPKDAIVFGLFNSWKVNGKYSFQMPKEEEIDKHKRYCKNSYKRYFKIAEERIKNQK